MDDDSFQLQCPVPSSDGETIQLGHGGGGRLTQELIQRVFAPVFQNKYLAQMHDGAVFQVDGGTLALTTDSYVVQPLMFPGGDIGSLAVFGTVNDLAMCGARPQYLSVGFILEEGLPRQTLEQVTRSVAEAARRAGVVVVTGDTKVVDRGKGDGIYLNTTGIGVVPSGVTVSPDRIRPGDRVLLSGDLGRHGIAVYSVREHLGFEGEIQSDSAPLHDVVGELLGSGVDVHCLRDLTRGGLASALNELATTATVGIRIEEDRLSVPDPVRGACEMLGLDPLYVANEGRFVAFVPDDQVDPALRIMQRHGVSSQACLIGEVTGDREPFVQMRTVIGTHRIVDLFSGEQLPRIC